MDEEEEEEKQEIGRFRSSQKRLYNPLFHNLMDKIRLRVHSSFRRSDK